jgi:hypothetical protein
VLQPSNQLPNDRDPVTVDVFPQSDRIVDLAAVGCASVDGSARLFVEIDHHWPPNKANILESGAWQLMLLVCGDTYD